MYSDGNQKFDEAVVDTIVIETEIAFREAILRGDADDGENFLLAPDDVIQVAEMVRLSHGRLPTEDEYIIAGWESAPEALCHGSES